MKMLRRLFNGGRKFVTLAVLVAVLGAISAWLWAQLGTETVPLRVVALDAEFSSIKVPINGEWKETGPIKISLASTSTQFGGQLTPGRETATLVWPVEISAPLLEELGLERVEAILVGLGKRRPNSESMIGVDFTVLRIPGLPLIVVDNHCCITCNKEIRSVGPFWQGKPGAELQGGISLRSEIFQEVNALELKREAFKVASSLFNFPLKDVNAFLENTLKLQQESLHEIVVYMPELDHYQTADLTATVTLRLGR